MRGMTIARVAALLAGCFAFAPATQAGPYPDKHITLIVPFVAGGSSDAVGRQIAPRASELLGQSVILDNRPGANGSIGAAALARANPDGYTILVGSVGVFAINPGLYKRLQYDPLKDFDLLTIAVRTPNVLVMHPKFPANTLAELITYMKKNPGKVTFASSGIGSADHLSTMLLWQKTGTSGLHVPYKGGGAAINDLLGGHADVLITNLGVLTGQIQSGNLKALAITGDKRSPLIPDVPTMAEAGVSGLEVFSWQAIAAPKGLPPDVKAKLESALTSTLKEAEVARRLSDIGFDVVASPSVESSAYVAAEIARWKSVMEQGNIALDQ